MITAHIPSPPVFLTRAAALTGLGLPVLQNRTTDRVAYTQAGNDGSSVLAGPDRTARDEITAIRHELEQLIHVH